MTLPLEVLPQRSWERGYHAGRVQAYRDTAETLRESATRYDALGMSSDLCEMIRDLADKFELEAMRAEKTHQETP